MRNKIIIVISTILVVISVIIAIIGVNRIYNKNAAHISDDLRYKLESVDKSDEEVSEDYYRSVGEEELGYLKEVCDKYDIDIDTADVSYDTTTDFYIIRTDTSTLYIDMTSGDVSISYKRQIDYAPIEN